MKLVHWSDRPVGPLVNVSQPPAEENWRMKPVGLWLSDESDYGWKQWCEDENFNVGGHVVQTEFNVDMKDVLHLSTPEQIDSFTDEYGVERAPYHDRMINWHAVAQTYKGILITPYCHARRLEHMWYYGWDCASGCFWDTSCLELIKNSHELLEA